GHRINSSDYSIAESYSNLEMQWAPDNRMCMLTINSGVYPLTYSDLRAAIAFAIDKNEAVPDHLNGYVDVVDFAVPLNNEYSIEDTEGGLFYDSNYTMAYNELEEAGMLDIDEDGMVEAPNGQEFSLEIWYPSDRMGFDVAASNIASRLLAVGINNSLVPIPYDVLQHNITHHNATYHLAFYNVELPSYGLDWAATTFHEDMISVSGQNIANIDDSSFTLIADSYIDQIDFDDLVAIGKNALREVRNLCPVIPLFAYRWLSVYTEANFIDWPDDQTSGAFSSWSPISVTPVAPSNTELVVAVLPEFFDEFFISLNPFKGNLSIDYNWAVGNQFNPYRLIYDSAIEISPDGRIVPREATSWEILYLGQIPDITYSQSRVSFYCDTNANWTDNTQFDAQDYRFAFEYYSYYNLTELSDVIDSVKVTGDYVAGITLNSKNMFNIREIGVYPIIPEHIWADKNPYTWEPSVQDAVGSGPYIVSEFENGSSLVLMINEEYYPVIDTEAPTFGNIVLDPEDPIPAESVVCRVYIYDRSRIENVTIKYTHMIGNINFTDSRKMSQSAIGYIASIPSRVTADGVYYEIHATDIWGNTAIVYSGSYYSRIESGLDPSLQAMLIYGSGGLVVILLLLIVVIRRRH
ncbi:MAG: ABC transporter substrate-binding protein, partial [Candidatus Thorarchaeota archaeon]